MECYCGKLFYQLNAFSNHQRHCKTSQRRLTSALSKAQQIWAKKRESQRLKRLQETVEEAGPNETPPPLTPPPEVPQNEEIVVPVAEPMVYKLYIQALFSDIWQSLLGA